MTRQRSAGPLFCPTCRSATVRDKNLHRACTWFIRAKVRLEPAKNLEGCVASRPAALQSKTRLASCWAQWAVELKKTPGALCTSNTSKGVTARVTPRRYRKISTARWLHENLVVPFLYFLSSLAWDNAPIEKSMLMLVGSFCISNLPSGTALQQDFAIRKLGWKHLIMNILAAVHFA